MALYTNSDERNLVTKNKQTNKLAVVVTATRDPETDFQIRRNVLSKFP